MFSHTIGKTSTFLVKKEVFNQPIILFTDKSIDTLSAFFGIALASDFYTLINPELPEVRIEQIKGVINSKIVFTDEEHLELAKGYFSDLEVCLIKDVLKTKKNEKIIKNQKMNTINKLNLVITINAINI